MPSGYYANFARWNQLSIFKTTREFTDLKSLVRSALEPEKLELFIDLVEHDEGYPLYQAISATKMALSANEEAEFHFPPRLALGAILLQAGRAAEAETVYWEDLRRNRENGWALFGLMQALRAQNKASDAALTEARFKAAWSRADVTLTASRFGR